MCLRLQPHFLLLSLLGLIRSRLHLAWSREWDHKLIFIANLQYPPISFVYLPLAHAIIALLLYFLHAHSVFIHAGIILILCMQWHQRIMLALYSQEPITLLILENFRAWRQLFIAKTILQVKFENLQFKNSIMCNFQNIWHNPIP